VLLTIINVFITTTKTVLTALFAGTAWASQCQKEASSRLYDDAREDNKRQTQRQSGWAPLHPDQSAIHLHQSPIRQMLYLPQPSQFILAWDRHRNMLDYIPHGLVINVFIKQLQSFTTII